MEVKRTKAWKAAEWDYCVLQADLQMAPIMGSPSQEDIARRLRGMVRRCPQFYPAVLELGLRQLAAKGDAVSVDNVEKGLRLMIELAGPRQTAEEIDGIVENLE